MNTIRLQTIPSGMDALFGEVADGLGDLYGPAAGADYLARAERAWAGNLAHEQVYAYGAFEGGGLAGVLLGVLHPPSAEVSFLHVLAPFRKRGVEHALLHEALSQLRATGVSRLLVECLPFCEMDLAPPCIKAGLQPVERLLMHAPLDHPALALAGDDATAALSDDDEGHAAACILAAYANEPARALHREALNGADAVDFLYRVRTGAFGVAHRDYLRGIPGNGEVQGVAVGCETAPGIGFVLQVAVNPAQRRRGHAAALLRGLAHHFRQQGLERIALGVTQTNPAMRLYERMGLTPLREVTAYLYA